MTLEELVKSRKERLLQAYTPEGELIEGSNTYNMAEYVIAGVIEHNKELWELLRLVHLIGFNLGVDCMKQSDDIDPENIPF